VMTGLMKSSRFVEDGIVVSQLSISSWSMCLDGQKKTYESA
jgi:hypothetical protein